MSIFVVQVTENKRVREWFKVLDVRLRDTSPITLFFKGGTRRIGIGRYVFSIEPVFPRSTINIMNALFILGCFFTWYYWLSSIALSGFFVGIFLMIVWNAFWYKALYLVTLSLQVSRLTKGWHPVKVVTDEVLRERWFF